MMMLVLWRSRLISLKSGSRCDCVWVGEGCGGEREKGGGEWGVLVCTWLRTVLWWK